MPYLEIGYKLEKVGGGWQGDGMLKSMQSKDGPHYADNIKMPGPGDYKLTYSFSPPGGQVFLRHVDKETGVPDWWQPFTQEFTFAYPQK